MTHTMCDKCAGPDEQRSAPRTATSPAAPTATSPAAPARGRAPQAAPARAPALSEATRIAARRATIVSASAPEGPTEGPDGVVTETQSLDGGTDGGGVDGGAANPAADHCAVTGRFTTIPSGTLVPTFTATKLGTSFSMVGEFTAPIPCPCARGEYRQYVRGTFTANGNPVAHQLGPGVPMSATTFQLDGNSTTANYFGRRDFRTSYTKFTNPDQATGCRYEGSDIPGLSAGTGTALGINLDFRGELIDTANPGTALATATWSVVGSGTVP